MSHNVTKTNVADQDQTLQNVVMFQVKNGLILNNNAPSISVEAWILFLLFIICQFD